MACRIGFGRLQKCISHSAEQPYSVDFDVAVYEHRKIPGCCASFEETSK